MKKITAPINAVDQDLLALLRQKRLLAEEHVARIEALSLTEQVSLDRAILVLGLVDEEQLLELLAQVLGLSHVSEKQDLRPKNPIIEVLTLDYCRSKLIAPVENDVSRCIFLTNDPANTDLKDEIEFLIETEPEWVVASERIIRSYLGTREEAEDTGLVSNERLIADQKSLKLADRDGPIGRFVSAAFAEAVALGASDIHFEAQEDGLRIRLRIDGQLEKYPANRSVSVASVIARLKVIAGMNVTERRLPQDGRISSTIAGRKIDFRVSSVPTSFGESIVCRVLDPKSLRLGWAELGFPDDIAQRVLQIVEQPNGMFLVTGPTGSGKTTTLYTALAHLNKEGRKILTIEDPIEYNLAGVEQVQVHEEIGLTFAAALRAFLRQDPNVLMVGEIRDEETAAIACRAALVGRVVLSTLHTNTPEGAVTRLVDLGVPEYVVNDVLRGVLGQQLEIIDGSRQLRSKLV